MNISKSWKCFLIVYLSVAALTISLLLISTLIPTSFLKKNVGQSIELITREGIYPSIGFMPWRKAILDNYTESLMLNTAYYSDSKDPIRSLMLNKRYIATSKNANQLDSLKALFDGKIGQETSYERYWHGYLIYLRPLLIVFPYTTIRLILQVIVYGLFTYLLFLVSRHSGLKSLVIFILAFLSIDFFYVGVSMQFSNIFILALATSIYFARSKNINITHVICVLFAAGSLTSVVDLLTIPVMSFCLPIVVIMVIHRLFDLKFLTVALTAWSVGYVAIWSTKWILALPYASSSISSALSTISSRTQEAADANFSVLAAIKLNILQLIGYSRESKILFVVILLLTLITTLILGVRKKICFTKIRAYLFILSIPYLWYVFAANHSYIHVWFTYRAQLTSVLMLLFIYAEIIDLGKLRNIAKQELKAT